MNTSINKIRFSFNLLSLLALVAVPIIVSAATYGTPITINNPTPAEQDFFGNSVAISGDKALIGVPHDNTGAFEAGSAYLFDATTGALLQTFNNPSPEYDDQFGNSVAISGDKVLISAIGDDTAGIGTGSVYLYDATTGALLRTFNNPTQKYGVGFGNSVSISGNRALIGAFAAANPTDPGTTGAGSAYLFDATTGALLQTFNNPSPAVRDYFGSSVSISGDKVLIGTPGEDGNWGADDTGAAYIYDATTGELLLKISNPKYVESDRSGSTAYDNFGRSVSISGDKVLIGAPGNNTGATDAGSAYLFDVTTSALLYTFSNPTPADYDSFGASVSISGDKVLIGALADDTGAFNAGSAYLYDATTGALLQTFNNPTPESNDLFGESVSISGDKVLISATGNNTGANQAGSAYLYLPDTDTDGIFDSVDNCPADYNPDQADTDSDGQGNICDPTPYGNDVDNDGIGDFIDNCPVNYNPDQFDSDGDGIGDVCDPTPYGDKNPDPTTTDQCKELGWVDFSFRNQGQCVAFVNTGHDTR